MKRATPPRHADGLRQTRGMPEERHDAEANEELRYAVRRYLAARPMAAVPLDTILPGLRAKGFNVHVSKVLPQLMYWVRTEPPQVQIVRPRHGSSQAFQITSAGVLAEERGE